MVEKFNSYEWDTVSFRGHAEAEIAKIDRQLDEVKREIFSTAEQFYRDEEVISLVFRVSREPSTDLFEVVRMLEEDPASLGRLRGNRLFNDRTHEAKERLAEMAPRLSERADLEKSRIEYERLGQLTIEAERLPVSERGEAMQNLRHELEYCDCNRDARASIAGRSPTPSDGGGSGGGGGAGGSGGAPGGGGGAGGLGGAGAPLNRDWWDKSQADQGEGASGHVLEVERPAARAWWDTREEPERTEGELQEPPLPDRYQR